MYQLFAKQLFVFINLLVLCISCETEPEILENESEYFFCGAENITYQNDIAFFDDGKGNFSFGGVQSEDAYEGKYSLMLDSLKEFGMSLRMFDIKPGTYFETSIWIKNPVNKATFIVGATGRSKFSIHTSEINKADEKNGWSSQKPITIRNMKAMNIDRTAAK